ncbi:MAG: hypothetical protein Q8O14_04760 [bacterium]|nr:hypothetical protein [bacterium]
MTTEDRSELAADLRRQAEAIMKMRAELPDVAPPGFRPKDTSMGGVAIDETLHELCACTRSSWSCRTRS